MQGFWKKNKLTAVTAALALLAIGVVAYDNLTQSSPNHSLAFKNDVLLETAKISEIENLKISRAESQTTIEKQASGIWYVSDSVEKPYPADAGKVIQFLDTVADAKIERVVSSSSENLESYGLELATELTLRGKENEILKLSLGAQREGGGQFILYDGKVYLINKPINADSSQSTWEAKTLVNIPANEIKKIDVQLQPSKKEFVLSREKTEDKITLEKAPTDTKYKESEQEAASKILEKLSFEKRLPIENAEAKAALKDSSKLLFSLFDDRQFSIKVGKIGKKGEEKYFLTMEAPQDSTKIEDQVTREMASGSAFQISSNEAKKFLKTKDDFLEK